MWFWFSVCKLSVGVNQQLCFLFLAGLFYLCSPQMPLPCVTVCIIYEIAMLNSQSCLHKAICQICILHAIAEQHFLQILSIEGLAHGSKNPCFIWNVTFFGSIDDRRDSFSGTKSVNEVCVSEVWQHELCFLLQLVPGEFRAGGETLLRWGTVLLAVVICSILFSGRGKV